MPIFAAAVLPFTMTAIGAGATAAGGIIGAHETASANEDAVAAQTKANEDALAFQEQQAAYKAQVDETNRRANYDQWAGREGQISSVGQMLGLPARQIPGYVPLPSGATTAVPGSATQPPPVVSPGQTPSVTPPPGYATSPTAKQALQPQTTGATGIPNPLNPGFDTNNYPLPATNGGSALKLPYQTYAPGTIGAYLGRSS